MDTRLIFGHSSEAPLGEDSVHHDPRGHRTRATVCRCKSALPAGALLINRRRQRSGGADRNLYCFPPMSSLLLPMADLCGSALLPLLWTVMPLLKLRKRSRWPGITFSGLLSGFGRQIIEPVPSPSSPLTLWMQEKIQLYLRLHRIVFSIQLTKS